MADFTAWAPIDWWAYYKRPLDGPECLRRMGYPPFPCRDCSREDGCVRPATEGSKQCPHIRHWMYDYWPGLTEKIRAAHGDSGSEDGKR